jgi:hypothetical protein
MATLCVPLYFLHPIKCTRTYIYLQKRTSVRLAFVGRDLRALHASGPNPGDEQQLRQARLRCVGEAQGEVSMWGNL